MSLTLHAAVAAFLASRDREGLSPRTVQTYRSILEAFEAAWPEETLLDEVSATAIQDYVDRLRSRQSRYRSAPQRLEEPGELSVETVRSHIRQLKAFWAWCVAYYDLEERANPMRKIRLPRAPQREPKGMDRDDLRRLIDSTGPDRAGLRDRAILYFLADTGVRAGGLVALRVEDLFLDRRRAIIRREKDRKMRTVPFSANTADVLRRWLEVRPPEAATVFCSLGPRGGPFEGDPMTPAGLYQVMKRLARRAGIKGRFNPHSLRHAFARDALRNGAGLATVSQIMGHSSITVTADVYGRFAPDELSEQHDRFSPIRHLNGKDKADAGR